jgi:hypothetical protein
VYADDVAGLLGREAAAEGDQAQPEAAPESRAPAGSRDGVGQPNGVGLLDERADVVLGDLPEDDRVHCALLRNDLYSL